MPDVFPNDLTQRIRDLEKAVEELKAIVASRTPLTEASQGWILRHRTAPSPPAANDVHIYGNTGRLWVTSTLGSVAVRDKTGTSVASVAGADADGTYSSNEQALINELKTQMNALLASLRAESIIFT